MNTFCLRETAADYSLAAGKKGMKLIKFIVSIRLQCLLCFALVFVPSNASVVQSQEWEGYKPIEGKTFEEVLNRLFPSEPHFDKFTRFSINVRILPPSDNETQIDIIYDVDMKSKITSFTLSRSLGSAINEYLSHSLNKPDITKLASLVRVIKREYVLDGTLVKAWMRELWASLQNFAAHVPITALEEEGSDKRTILMDPTMYVIYYQDERNYFRLDLPGPDPKWNGDLNKLEPLIKWIIMITREVEALGTSTSKNPGGK